MSIYRYKVYKKSPLRFFTYFLGITVITEFTAHILNSHFIINNSFVYNLFIPIVNLFYYWFYKNIFQIKKHKKLMNVFSIIFVLTYILEFVFDGKNFATKTFSYSLIIGAIFIVITILLFIIEIVSNDKILGNINKTLLFWISIGSLIFYVGIIPIFINNAHFQYKIAYFYIIKPLNIIMYSSFIIGYIVANLTITMQQKTNVTN